MADGHVNVLPYSVLLRDYFADPEHFRDSTMANAARAFGFSCRTLRRRLIDEGTKFKTVRAQAFVLLVQRLVLDPSQSIGDLSRVLGFADRSTFHRAFKRSFGVTPHEYRRGKRDLPAQLEAPLQA